MRHSGVGNDVGRAGDTARGQRIDLWSWLRQTVWTLMNLDSINQQSLATCVCGGGGDEGASGVWGLGAHLQRGLWSPPSLDMSVVTAGFWV